MSNMVLEFKPVLMEISTKVTLKMTKGMEKVYLLIRMVTIMKESS